MTVMKFIFQAIAAVAAISVAPGLMVAAADSTPPAQDTVPWQSEIWRLLRHTKIGTDFKNGVYTATHPPEVQALVGETVTVQGFVLPVKAETEFRHFLLMPYTASCPFCPAASPNEIIDVTTDHPIKAEERLFTVTGKFALQNDGENGVFFRLDDADVK